MEPSEIKVIVHGARNLKVRKSRRGKCKASVVFGIGDQRYQTSDIKDCNPDWNEESIFRITKSSQPLVLTVKDKDDVLGSIRINLEDIGNSSSKRRMPLGTNKKHPSLGGDLIFDCWVTEYARPVPEIVLDSTENGETVENTPAGGRLDAFLKRMSPKNSRHKESDHTNNNVSSSSLRRCNSTPFQIDQIGKDDENHEYGDNLTVKRPNKESISDQEEKSHKSKIHVKLRKTFDHSKLAQSWEKRRSGLREPKITDVFPWTAHTEGGTKITLTGDNFGCTISDISSLKFCGVECKDGIAYISPKKLEFRTLPSATKEGYVILETIYGSRVQSSTFCQYADLNNPFEEVNTNPFEIDEKESPEKNENGNIEKNSHKILGILTKKLTKIDKEEDNNVVSLLEKLDEKDKTISELQSKVESLTETIEELTKQKNGLQGYIDGLVAKVMEVCPEALENCDFHA